MIKVIFFAMSKADSTRINCWIMRIFFIKREHHFFYIYAYCCTYNFFVEKNGFNLWWFNPIYFWRKKKKDEGKLWIMWWMPGLGLYTIILFTTVNLDNFDVVFKSRICQITNAHSSHALNLDLLRLKFWGFHYIFKIQICNLFGVKKILKKNLYYLLFEHTST